MNILRITFDPRLQAADAPDDHLHLYAGLGSLDQFIHDLLIRQRIDLNADIGLFSFLRPPDFPVDKRKDAALQAVGRHQKTLGLLDGFSHRKGLKHLQGVQPDLLVPGDQRQIRIKPGGLFIIVSSPDLRNVFDPVFILPGNQTQLRMDLIAVQAVDHMTSGVL